MQGKGRERGGDRKPGNHNNGCRKHERGKYVKNKGGSLEYRNAALASGHTVKGQDAKTARKGNATTNRATLRRLCMMVRKHDKELSAKPMKWFLIANEHDIRRIENLLFEVVMSENKK